MRNGNDNLKSRSRKTRQKIQNTVSAKSPYNYGSKTEDSPLPLEQERDYIRARREIYHKSRLETEVALLKYSSIEKFEHSPKYMLTNQKMANSQLIESSQHSYTAHNAFQSKTYSNLRDISADSSDRQPHEQLKYQTSQVQQCDTQMND